MIYSFVYVSLGRPELKNTCVLITHIPFLESENHRAKLIFFFEEKTELRIVIELGLKKLNWNEVGYFYCSTEYIGFYKVIVTRFQLFFWHPLKIYHVIFGVLTALRV